MNLNDRLSLLLIATLGWTWGCTTAPAIPPAAGAVASGATVAAGGNAPPATTTSSGTPASGGGATLGQPLPDLSLPALADGPPLALASLRGQVVLLDIWASWCAPCREEMPLLDEIARRLAGKGVRVVAVSVDEDRAAALEFLRMQPDWQLRVAHDTNQDAARALQPPKMPTSYLIDRAGRLRHVHAGFERADAARIEGELLALAELPSP